MLIQLPTSKPLSAHCPSCDLHTSGGPLISPRGNGQIPLLILGDFPTFKDTQDRRPFSEKGRSGSVLHRALSQANISWDSIWVWNAINCTPPHETLTSSILPSAIRSCRNHLEMFIAKYRPQAILACGDLALSMTTTYSGSGKQNVRMLRGYILDSQWGIPVVPTIDPSLIVLQDKPAFRELILHDLLRAKALALNPHIVRPDTSRYELFVPALRLREMYEYLLHHPSAPIYYDIETAESFQADEDLLRATPSGVEIVRESDLDTLSDEELPWDDAPSTPTPAPSTSTVITQYQIATDVPDWCMVSHWTPAHQEWIQKIHALSNLRVGHNNRIFDDPILRAHSITLNGPRRDNMDDYHRIAPDLPRHLQSVTSFYWPEALPWKHLAQSDPGPYGCNDVISLQKSHPAILRKASTIGNVYNHITVGDSLHIQDTAFVSALDAMQDRGYPFSASRQAQVKEEVSDRLSTLYSGMAALYPTSILPLDPKSYATKPTTIRKGFTPDDLVLTEVEVPEMIEQAVLRSRKGKTPPPDITALEGKPLTHIEEKAASWFKSKRIPTGRTIRAQHWRYRLPFKPSSRNQILNYLSYRCAQELEEFREKDSSWSERPDKLPRGWKTNHVWYVPEDPKKKGKPWIGVKGLERLQRKLATQSKTDPFITLLCEYTKTSKLRDSFLNTWHPTSEDLVHTTYKLSPATGQIAANNPNVLAAPKHGVLAKKWRFIQQAHPGHRWINFDFGGFHVQTMAFEANCPSYSRIGRIDIHGFLGYIAEKLPDWQRMVDCVRHPSLMTNEEITDRLKRFARKEVQGFKERRDKIYKIVILGVQLGAQAETVFNTSPEAIGSRTYAQSLIDLEKSLWPEIFTYQSSEQQIAHRERRIVSRYGHVRYFWEVFSREFNPRTGLWQTVSGNDSEKASAFKVQNDAFGHVRDSMIWLHTQRCPSSGLTWAEKFGLVNSIHDSLEFHCPVEHTDECIALVSKLLQRRNQILISPQEPEGLWCGVECSVSLPNEGQDTLQEVAIPAGPFHFPIEQEIGWTPALLKTKW